MLLITLQKDAVQSKISVRADKEDVRKSDKFIQVTKMGKGKGGGGGGGNQGGNQKGGGGKSKGGNENKSAAGGKGPDKGGKKGGNKK